MRWRFFFFFLRYGSRQPLLFCFFCLFLIFRDTSGEWDMVPCSLFARLISHEPAVLFSQNESATSNQPQPVSSTLLSEQTSHQPTEQADGRMALYCSVRIALVVVADTYLRMMRSCTTVACVFFRRRAVICFFFENKAGAVICVAAGVDHS
jgi:hypothetical protein